MLDKRVRCEWVCLLVGTESSVTPVVRWSAMSSGLEAKLHIISRFVNTRHFGTCLFAFIVCFSSETKAEDFAFNFQRALH
jgi:hypothetical protein